MEASQLRILVNYFLNVFADVDDPIGALTHYMDGDRVLAERWFAAWQSLAKTDFTRYRKAMGPEAGDVTLRVWICEAVSVIQKESLPGERAEQIVAALTAPKSDAAAAGLSLWVDAFNALEAEDSFRFERINDPEFGRFAMLAWIHDAAAQDSGLR